MSPSKSSTTSTKPRECPRKASTDFGRLSTVRALLCPSLLTPLHISLAFLYKILTVTTLLDVNAVIHPATGEKIPAAFRMSAFVPANVLIAAGLLLPGAGVRKLSDSKLAQLIDRTPSGATMVLSF